MTGPRPIVDDHELSDDELEKLRLMLESFDVVMTVSPTVRALIAERWPHLLAKIKPDRTN